MFRLLVNIGGMFDVYVSSKAPELVQSATLPSLAATGRVAGIVVERMRFAEGADYGRNRYLLLLTPEGLADDERRRLVASLEQVVGAEFDRLMKAVNRDEVSDDLRRIYAACAQLTGQEVSLSGSSMSEKSSEPPDPVSPLGASSQFQPVAVPQSSAEVDQRNPRHLESDVGSRRRQEDGIKGSGSRDSGSAPPRRSVMLGMIIVMNVLLVGLLFGSMTWYLERVITRETPAGVIDGLPEKVEELSTKMEEVRESVSEVNKAVTVVRSRAFMEWSGIQSRLGRIEEKVGKQGRTVDAIVAEVEKIKETSGDAKKQIEELRTWLQKNFRIMNQLPGGHTEVAMEPANKKDWSPSPEAIDEVQTILKGYGFYEGQIDGHWGPGTESGIRKWQDERNRSVTGVLDWSTYQAILSEREDDGRRPRQ